MLSRIPPWLNEPIKILSQWLGIGLASIVGGVLLGVLLKSGISERKSLGFAVPVTLVLSWWLWHAIAGRFRSPQTQYELGASHVQFESFTTPRPAMAFGVVVYCASLYMPPHAVVSPQRGTTVTITGTTLSVLRHAIPQY
jgi:hypothetical protein